MIAGSHAVENIPEQCAADNGSPVSGVQEHRQADRDDSSLEIDCPNNRRNANPNPCTLLQSITDADVDAPPPAAIPSEAPSKPGPNASHRAAMPTASAPLQQVLAAPYTEEIMPAQVWHVG
jgi:hypothetical protein